MQILLWFNIATYNLIISFSSTSPFLIGELEPEDKITEVEQKSWINMNNQISFFEK